MPLFSHQAMTGHSGHRRRSGYGWSASGRGEAHEAAQIAADLLARRGLAGAQDHGDRAAGGGVIDVDRQEATLVVGVEERQLLMAVNDIEPLVDVEGDAFRRRGVARQPQIDQHAAELDDGPDVAQVLQPRTRRLQAPQPLDEDVVAPGTFALHADGHARPPSAHL